MAQASRNQARLRKALRIRNKLHSKTIKHRLFVHKSLQNFEAQLFDEITKKVIASVSTVKSENYGGNIKAASELGLEMAKRLKALKITQIIFDRSGYIYHGRVKAFVEKIKEQGVKI